MRHPLSFVSDDHIVGEADTQKRELKLGTDMLACDMKPLYSKFKGLHTEENILTKKNLYKLYEINLLF